MKGIRIGGPTWFLLASGAPVWYHSSPGIDCERLRGHRHGPQRPEPQGDHPAQSPRGSCLRSACSRAGFNPWPGWDLRTGGLNHDLKCTCAFQPCTRAQSFSHVRLFATPRTVAPSAYGISDKCPQIVSIIFLSFSCLQSWFLIITLNLHGDTHNFAHPACDVLGGIRNRKQTSPVISPSFRECVSTSRGSSLGFLSLRK